MKNLRFHLLLPFFMVFCSAIRGSKGLACIHTSLSHLSTHKNLKVLAEGGGI